MISDIYEEFSAYDKKGVCFTFDDGNYGMLIRGAPTVQASWDLPKPVFNAFKLLHGLGDTRIDLTGGTTSDGVNGCATISSDSSSVQVLLYNHFDGGFANIASSDNIALTVNNLPFGAGKMTVRHQVVDGTRSNAYRAWKTMGSLTQPTATQWTTLINAAQLADQDQVSVVNITGNSWTKNFPQYYYSVGLITLIKGDVSAVRKDGGVPLISGSKVRRIAVHGRAIEVSGPQTQAAEVLVLGTNGATVAQMIGDRAGVCSIPGWVPAGAYFCMLKGRSQSTVVPVLLP